MSKTIRFLAKVQNVSIYNSTYRYIQHYNPLSDFFSLPQPVFCHFLHISSVSTLFSLSKPHLLLQTSSVSTFSKSILSSPSSNLFSLYLLQPSPLYTHFPISPNFSITPLFTFSIFSQPFFFDLLQGSCFYLVLSPVLPSSLSQSIFSTRCSSLSKPFLSINSLLSLNVSSLHLL